MIPSSAALAPSLALLLASAPVTRGGYAQQSRNLLPDLKAAVIVPGFLTGGNDFDELAEELTSRGLPAVAVPMPAWHWVPCLGGRSVRPILERLDFTVRHLAASNGDVDAVPRDLAYSLEDLWGDFRDNPGGVYEVGGSAEPDEFPAFTPRGAFFRAHPCGEPKGRVGLIGHSAGGWISRLYLSRREYGGRAYRGQDLVHSLVTLGTPHGNAPGFAFRNVEWCNREARYDGVRGLAVGGVGFRGDRSGDFTRESYSFCCPEGNDGTGSDGDGTTTIDSALAWEGAEKLVLESVTHFPWSDVWGAEWYAPDLTRMHRDGVPWYGSKSVVDRWAGWLDV